MTSIPRLPQHEDDSAQRTQALEQQRQELGYNHQLVSGLPFASCVPKEDRFSLKYVLQIGKVRLQIVANIAEINLRKFYQSFRKGLHVLSEDLFSEHRHGTFSESLRHFSREFQHEGLLRPRSIDEYRQSAQAWEQPLSADRFQDDDFFTQQRLAGANPFVISRVTKEQFSDSGLAGVLTQCPIAGEMGEAVAAGRIYMCDYSILRGIPTGEVQGISKVLYAPQAYFALSPERERLQAVGISLDIESDDVVVPGDGLRWQMAKLAVQSADAHHHELVSHLAHAHLVIEPISIATFRQLSPLHPLYVLLRPHLEFTLDINDHASRDLINPSGQVEQLMAATHEGDLEVIERAMSIWEPLTFPEQLSRRGVDDVELFPDYPLRDDGLLVWSAIANFVDAYLAIYYSNDQDVVADTELQAWLSELRDPERGALARLPAIENLDDLADWIAYLIFTASVQHAVANFGQFPYAGFTPNMPAALFAEVPERGAEVSEADFLNMLPPLDSALSWNTLMYQLSQIRVNILGQYPEGTFSDTRVQVPLHDFVTALAEGEKVMRKRNSQRSLAFDCMYPSQIPASIHI